MDRRGRGSSGDTGPYELSKEFADVAAVAASLAADGPVDVFGHSIGATCALGAVGLGAPVRRLACTNLRARRPRRRSGETG